MTEFLFDTKYTVFICYNEVFWYYFLKRFGSKLCNLEKRWRPVHLCQICVDQSNTDPKLHVAWMAHNININEAKWNLGKVNLETLLVSSLLINASGGSGPCCRAHVCWLSAIALLAVCWPTPPHRFIRGKYLIVSTDYQCDRCLVVDCGMVAMVTTYPGDGFPPGWLPLRHLPSI